MATNPAAKAFVLSLILGTAISRAALGQPNQPVPPGTPASAPGSDSPSGKPQPIKPLTTVDPSPVELADEPFRLEAVGLTMQVPAGTTVQANRAGGRSTAQILPDERNRTWMITVQTPQTTNPQATIKDSADQTIALLQGSVGVTDPENKKVLQTEARIIDRAENLTLKGGPCERFYLSMPGNPGGGEKTRVVKGYTIFKPSPTQFVVFELVTPESEFSKTRRLFETCIATAEFVDPVALVAARGAAVQAGIHLIENLTSKEYESILDGKERWYRLYKEAKSGLPLDAQELGYRGVTFWRGKRVELDSTRAPRNATERQEGYLARFRYRLVDAGGRADGQAGPVFIDTTASYFMTPDRNEEAWLIVSARRDSSGKILNEYREIGARSNDDLTILIEEPKQAPKTIKPLFQKAGYVCQVESFMLPQLLVRSGVAAEFGFYAYRSQSETVALRRDTLAREPGAGGAWMLKTEYREDLGPQLSFYNDKGELLRSELGDGRRWKPVESKELFDLWKSKGLPTGTLK